MQFKIFIRKFREDGDITNYYHHLLLEGRNNRLFIFYASTISPANIIHGKDATPCLLLILTSFPTFYFFLSDLRWCQNLKGRRERKGRLAPLGGYSSYRKTTTARETPQDPESTNWRQRKKARKEADLREKLELKREEEEWALAGRIVNGWSKVKREYEWNRAIAQIEGRKAHQRLQEQKAAATYAYLSAQPIEPRGTRCWMVQIQKSGPLESSGKIISLSRTGSPWPRFRPYVRSTSFQMAISKSTCPQRHLPRRTTLMLF